MSKIRRFIVFHRKNPTFRTDNINVFFRGDYERVAVVECEEIGDVFQYTNHIDHHWWDNDEVTWHEPMSRSTSVGDVVR